MCVEMKFKYTDENICIGERSSKMQMKTSALESNINTYIISVVYPPNSTKEIQNEA